MLRRISSTAFLGTILFASAAVAQPSKPASTAAQPRKPASDEKLMESGKPGNPPPENIPVPAAAAAPEAAAPVAVPAPPPPAPEVVAEPAAEAPKAQKKRTVEGAGFSSQSLSSTGGVETSETAVSDKDWGFRFKGYFRGPLRLGIDFSGTQRPGETQFHAPPVTPDGNYTRWNFTGVTPGPWAELFFQYGNQRVMMTTTIASYNITAGGWREMQDQLGIDRAFLTLKFPEALGDVGGMAWDVGVFSNFYGGLGKYDGGEYQTYLFARTRNAGATATADLEITDDLKVVLEAGAGAKMDQQYQTYGLTPLTSSTREPDTYSPSWQPYPGDKEQVGTALLAHGHAGLIYRGILTGTAHYIGTFVRDARWNVGSQGGSSVTRLTPDASIQVFGVDLRLDGGWMGIGYLGYSRLKANHANSVPDTIEILHSQGGWQLAHNFFYDGNGTIDSVAGQYTFSLASFLMRPRPFWGQGPDLTVTLFGMWNRIANAPKGVGNQSTIWGEFGGSSNMQKLKYGGDIIYNFIPKMSVGFRFDIVNPNMDDSTQSFQAFTPKLIFRSEFVTHEMIVLQGSWYHYGSGYYDPVEVQSIMPWPFGMYGTLNLANLGTTQSSSAPPDKWVIGLAASMWW